MIARVKAKPGFEEKLKQECLLLVAASRKEPGCINYVLYQSSEDPTVLIFYENWQTIADIERHLEQPHCCAFDEGTTGLLAEPEEITFCELVK